MHRSVPLLSMRGVCVNFGGVRAAVDVDLDVWRGEVVALVGDNAAGKSTIARVIAGVVQPASGVITMDAEPVDLRSPQAAFAAGIASVFQEFALVENLDVTSNIFLGRELSSRAGVMRSQRMNELARHYLDQLHARIPDLRQPLGELTAGQRQSVAIARTLVSEPRLVVLDEPTASLSVAQTAEVLNYVERLRDLGLGVILISHNLNDVRAVADRVEVLRHGHNNGSFLTETATYEEILSAITGATHVVRSGRSW